MTAETSLAEHAAAAAAQYGRVREDWARCARKIESMLTDWLDEERINYESVAARAKTVRSFREKAGRGQEGQPDLPRYADPLRDITDLMGARVITYLPESVERACEVIHREFTVVEHQDKGQRAKDRGSFGYASRHFLVRLTPERAALSEYRVLRGKTFEIQVRTAVQHAWAEFEHDVRYKVAVPDALKPELDRRFLLAAALIELADAEFTRIDELFREVAKESAQTDRERPGESGSPASRSRREGAVLRRLEPVTLMNWLAERYPEASKSKVEHYEWMTDILEAFGLRDASALELALAGVSSDAVAAAMGHRFPPGQVRRLDDDLLAALGEQYVAGQPDTSDRRESVLRRRATALSERST